MTRTPEEIKACCAASYSSDAVALLLGESYHPGGAALTRRLAECLRLRDGLRAADVAAGQGVTARLLAAEYGVRVAGVELDQSNVESAQSEADGSGFRGTVEFHAGDAERLPFVDGSFDAVVCECAFCTFPGKAVAAAEFARILRPGGRIGIADVTVSERGLPDELSTLAAWVACIADARPLAEYDAILRRAGLRTVHTEPHDAALDRMVDEIEARLRLLRMTAPGRLDEAGVDVDAVLRYTKLVKQAVADGLIGYSLLVAQNGDTMSGRRGAASHS